MELKNKVQLITYPDSLGGNLQALKAALSKYFPNLFEGGIHILPPYPSSGDRGFAPLTYLEIDPQFGSWNDIRQLSQDYHILLDLMVNHISRKSEWFQDFLNNGDKSEWAELFLTPDKIWESGKPVAQDVALMFLRRKQPWSEYETGPGKKKQLVWTTFGKENPSEQIDLDINAPLTRRMLESFLENFAANGVKIVRLDAVGYIIKKPGTSCFFVEPEIYRFIDWISEKATSLGLALLPEVHSHYSIQYKLAEKGHWIYDFILPFTILEALINGSGERLKKYLADRPAKQFTMLDCHDGIPVKPDLDGLVSSSEARKIVDVCLERGANLSYVFSDKHKAADGFDVHQIRCSYYSVLNNNDNAYIAARAIQFFAPGIPQVYYVGLLAGENDMEMVNKTGEGREINRHNFSMEEIAAAAEKPVVKRLQQLIRFRNTHPAFDGELVILDSPDHILSLNRKHNGAECTLTINLNDFSNTITYTGNNGEQLVYNA